MTVYDVGDRLRLGNHVASGAAAFTDLAGAATNPTAVTLTVEEPDGTVTEYAWPTPGAGQLSLTQEAAQTGRFYADVSLDQAGIWRVELAGTGAVVAAEQMVLHVRRRLVG